jgi:hypothetical protein
MEIIVGLVLLAVGYGIWQRIKAARPGTAGWHGRARGTQRISRAAVCVSETVDRTRSNRVQSGRTS